LADAQKNFGKRLFDVIMMDPPWQLSSSQPSRGVAIAYSSLADEIIQKIPLPKLQTDGFIFLW
jgi:mRNA (2'-O-methyladenosine-N6-)-methyltransferase